MNEKERIFILIDGNNFYHRLKEISLKRLLAFDYEKFAQFLIRHKQHKSIVSKIYYIGAVREERDNPQSKEFMRNQQKLFSKLEKQTWSIGLGQLLKTNNGYHEKGVDVLMAVDLLIGAYENFYDTAIVISSDTDLIPALAKIRSMKKKVEYIGFSHKPSHALIAHSDVRRLLTKEELEQFIL